MFIGIDIGGTFTDGVVISGQEVIKAVKVRTDEEISFSIEEALKQILTDLDPQKVEQVTLSTTLITNLITQERLPQTGMLFASRPGC